MTISTNAALASLLGSAAASSGEGVQVMFVPMSQLSSTAASRPAPLSASATRSAVNMDPFLFGGGGTAAVASGEEPPRRRRRLEPLRAWVRERCRAKVEARCAVGSERLPMERLRLLDPASSLSSPTVASLEREVDSFFEALFAPSYQTRGFSASPQRSLRMDPFDRIMSDMLDFSLRAFDEVMATDAGEFVSPPKEAAPPAAMDEGEQDEGEEEVKDLHWVGDWVGDFVTSSEDDEEGSKDIAVSPPKEAVPPATEDEAEESDLSWSEDVGNDMLIDEAYFEEEEGADAAPMTPWQAAENALDVMVASLARSAVAGNQDGAKEDAGEKAGREDFGLPSVQDLPERLFQMGQDLLTDISARRRLSEEGGEADPRLRAKQRLARRLTEYRTNLVYSPSSNSITLYTNNVGPNLNFSPTRSLVTGTPSLPRIPPLGMGSADADECLRSQFDNGDLMGTECHRAVGELLLATDRGSIEPPPLREFTAESARDRGWTVLTASEPRGVGGPAVAHEDRTTTGKSEEVDGPAIALKLLFLRFMTSHVGHTFLLTALLLLSLFFCAGDEEEEGADEEDVDEFDYVGLPEDDAGEVRLRALEPREGYSGEGEALVFVGVQVWG